MRLLIVGGKLQGTEAAYLAAKAGWETVLVDRREAPPAAGLADVHVIADVTADEARTRSLVTSCDAVLPACEDEPTLAWLAERVPAWDVPLLFDLDAYRVTASKLASRRLFAELDVPRPGDWPACGFPVVVKPSTASGSEGVVVAHDEAELDAARRELERGGHEVVVEEYVAGPSLSLEVLAWGGRAVPLQVTGLEFDAAYDCRRVVAPVGEATAGDPAAAGPGGACDWEAAVAPGVLAALDDAGVRSRRGPRPQRPHGRRGDGERRAAQAARDRRPPAQPDADGGLLVERAQHRGAAGARPCATRRRPWSTGRPRRACVYQHVRAARGMLEVLGEHVMGERRAAATGARLLRRRRGAHRLRAADAPSGRRRSSWRRESACEARARAAAVVAELARYEGLRAAPEDELTGVSEGGPR